MARPIKETPILYGEDARRFENELNNVQPLSKEEKERIRTHCDHRTAIEAYCRDWDRSGIGAPLAFAQKVNAAGHVLNLPAKRV